MKNTTTTTAAAIAAIEAIASQAIEAITAIMNAATPAETTTETATTTPAETATTTTAAATATDAGNKSHLEKFLDSWSKAPTAGELKEMIDQNPCDPIPADPTAIVVIDDDDNVIAVGSTTETTTDEDAETTGDLPCPPDAAETAAAENADDPATPSEEILDKIIADISALFYIAEYSLYNEAEKIGHDNSPYSPKDNTVGDIGDYKIFISKEIIKSADHVEGSFRMIIKDKVIVNPICDYDVRIIDNHIKVFSSENTVRVEKMKENHKVVKFLEVVDDTCYLVKDKYISE